jgi:hypothetical protein
MIRETKTLALEFLYIFPFLTVQHIRLLFGHISGSYASTILQELWKQEFIQRRSLPSLIHAGSVPWIYVLAKKGRRYLRGKGYDFQYHPYPSQVFNIQDYDALRHDFSVTNFLVAGCLLPKQRSDISLQEVIHDRILRAMLHTSPVVFDGFERFIIRGTEEHCIALELERTVKSESQFEQKIEATLAFISPDPFTGKSQYEILFKTTSLTIAYVTSISEVYCFKLRQITEMVLTRLHRQADADVLRFLYLPEEKSDPSVYLTPCWSLPFSSELVSLLEL